jgi:hypothetical protein
VDAGKEKGFFSFSNRGSWLDDGRKKRDGKGEKYRMRVVTNRKVLLIIIDGEFLPIQTEM